VIGCLYAGLDILLAVLVLQIETYAAGLFSRTTAG
jgi:hypothetical protein